MTLTTRFYSALKSLFPSHRKAEVGFLGGIVLTFEHIIGEISPAVPFVGLILSAFAFFLDLVINFDQSHAHQNTWKVCKTLLFTGAAICCFVFPHLAFIIGISATSLFLLENVTDFVQSFSLKGETEKQKNTARMQVFQKSFNLAINLASIVCLTLSAFNPGIMIGLIGVMATIVIKYCVFTYVINDYEQKDINQLHTSRPDSTQSSSITTPSMDQDRSNMKEDDKDIEQAIKLVA